jgi:D-amino-acid oxidase
MPGRDFDALVIGAGVSGLTTAVHLAGTGRRVRVWSADPPEATTSMAAGAMWGPYLVEPVDKVRAWSGRTLEELRRLATAPDTGVRFVPGIEASRRPVAPPEWGDQLDGYRMCQPGELPDGFATGWRFTAPLVDMSRYLTYLMRQLAVAGGAIEIRRVSDLGEAAEAAPVVVNCTGIGARELVPDPELTAIRGQLVVVENPGITEFFTEDTGPVPDLLNIYPHGDTVVLGGLAAPGDYSLQPDPDVATAIVARCVAVEPRLRAARALDHRGGLRPTRPRVRVETQQVNGTTLVHNYGHGGAGVTLSWGCAMEVAERVNTAGNRP